MRKIHQLHFNDPAPDVELATTDSGPVHLSTLWAKRTLLLLFTRHFGCPQCKEMLDEIVRLKAEIEHAGLGVAVITQATLDEMNAFCQRYAPGMLCFSDQQRQSYRAYRLERGSLRQTILSLHVWRSNAQARKKGFNVEFPPPGQDAMQMAGMFIIGTDGLIRLPYYYDDIADHPPAQLLLNGVLSTKWDTPFRAPLGSTGQY